MGDGGMWKKKKGENLFYFFNVFECVFRVVVQVTVIPDNWMGL